MEMNDLRIGNIVLCSGNPEVVTGVLQYGVYFAFGYCPNVKDKDGKPLIEPILLTEEWLIKFGFENGFKQFEWLNWGMYCEKGLADDWIVSVGFGNVKHEVKALKHVHKLQNIYFEYSDEELIIKNEK